MPDTALAFVCQPSPNHNPFYTHSQDFAGASYRGCGISALPRPQVTSYQAAVCRCTMRGTPGLGQHPDALKGTPILAAYIRPPVESSPYGL